MAPSQRMANSFQGPGFGHLYGEYREPPMELMELLLSIAHNGSVCLRISLAWCGFLSNKPYHIDIFTLPRLTSFTYDNPHRHVLNTSTVSGFPLDLTGASNLRNITLGDWLTNTTTAVIMLPVNRITSLYFLEFSRTTPSIRLIPQSYRSPCIGTHPQKEFESYIIAAHSRLRTLHLSFRNTTNLSVLISCLTLPSLKHLEVHVTKDMLMDLLQETYSRSCCDGNASSHISL